MRSPLFCHSIFCFTLSDRACSAIADRISVSISQRDPSTIKTGSIGTKLKSLLPGNAPFTIRRGEDGQLECYCLKCQAKHRGHARLAGEVAVQCPHCGERLTWQSDASQLDSQIPKTFRCEMKPGQRW